MWQVNITNSRFHAKKVHSSRIIWTLQGLEQSSYSVTAFHSSWKPLFCVCVCVCVCFSHEPWEQCACWNAVWRKGRISCVSWEFGIGVFMNATLSSPWKLQQGVMGAGVWGFSTALKEICSSSANIRVMTPEVMNIYVSIEVITAKTINTEIRIGILLRKAAYWFANGV